MWNRRFSIFEINICLLLDRYSDGIIQQKLSVWLCIIEMIGLCVRWPGKWIHRGSQGLRTSFPVPIPFTQSSTMIIWAYLLKFSSFPWCKICWKLFMILQLWSSIHSLMAFHSTYNFHGFLLCWDKPINFQIAFLNNKKIPCDIEKNIEIHYIGNDQYFL